MAFNGLSDAQAERLALLSEELGEAQQAIGKILRHGYDSSNPYRDQGLTNRQKLESEIGDVVFAVSLLTHEGDVRSDRVDARVAKKGQDAWRFLHHNFNTKPSA